MRIMKALFLLVQVVHISVAGPATADNQRELDHQLMKALYSPNDLEGARELLETGADVNYRETRRKNELYGMTPLSVILTRNPYETNFLPWIRLFLEHGADPNIVDMGWQRRPPLIQGLLKTKGTDVYRPTIELLLEYGADPTLKDINGDSALSIVAGYRAPVQKPRLFFADPEIYRLMLSYVDDRSKLDHTMQYCGYKVQRTDRKLSYIAQKVYGDRERWRELAALNNISKDNPYRAGDCLKVFDVEW